MNKTTNLLLSALALCAGACQAQVQLQVQELERQFPAAAAYCESSGNGLPNSRSIQIKQLSGSGTALLSAAVVIRDQSNRTIVSGLLPQAWQGMCSFGVYGSLERIWILTPTQARQQANRAKALARARAAS